ncbi:MAG: AI-2E family transporter [Actinomycetota bacterium]|nr:AI-2E family transporter [Actinomycetota bacterium]
MPPARTREPIPWRVIFASIFAVLAVFTAVVLLRNLARVVTWLVIAGFFAVLLTPPVDFLVRRLRFRRALATLLVFLLGFGLFAALMYAFVRPIVDQSQQFVDNFPRYVTDAKEGRGPMGDLVTRYDLDERLEANQDRLRETLNELGRNSLDILRSVGNAVVAGLTILVLAFLMIVEGPIIVSTVQNALSPSTRKRVGHVAADCAKSVTGYMAGNLLISVVAGTATFAWLFAVGVPFRGVLALWVAFADLIPLVGATLGAIPTILVAFLHSTTAGIATTVFFIAYQQFENHVLQVTIMARTVKLNPLSVLVSVLVGVELFGILGALLAIPAAGIIQVIVRDVYDEHTGRLKDEPTVGEEQRPVGAEGAAG